MAAKTFAKWCGLADSLTVRFDFDASASDVLVPGQIYRWRVYADDDASPGVQNLLSASEYLMGLFRSDTVTQM